MTDRRTFLAGLTGFATAAVWAADAPTGLVVGQPEGAAAGNAMLAAGGNAVDAIVTAALVAGVAAVPLTGIGGYGGHLVIAGLPGGKVTAIDFNTAAPAALTADYYRASPTGAVKDDVNAYGWQAVGVPGVLAGLQLALDRYGTRKFADVVPPAIRVARTGVTVNARFAQTLQQYRTRLAADPGSAPLLLPHGTPLAEGATLRNPDLAALLERLAERGSVADAYTGKIAEQIVTAVRAGGGLLTLKDLADYRAVEVTPLAQTWNGVTLHTPPPSSGGLTVLQTIATLRALGWPGAAEQPARAYLEALRLAWTDRLHWLGDPQQVEVPTVRLLSEAYAQTAAEKVRAALAAGKPVAGASDGRSANGTVHLNAIDARGLTVALTFTHGGYYGAQVTVPGLGLLLGQGNSRFDPRAGRANSPAPGKRPLHNMCPTVVTRAGQPVLAIGATGGRKIVNAVTGVLAARFGQQRTLADAVAAPRVHTEGDLALTLDEQHPTATEWQRTGYTLTTGTVAALNALERTPSGIVSAVR